MFKRIVIALALLAAAYVTPVSAPAQTVTPIFNGMEFNQPCTTAWPHLHVSIHRILDDICNGNHVYWSNIETARGVYYWTDIDQIVTNAQNHGAKVIYTMSHVPSWSNGGGGRAVPPLDFQDAYDFAAAFVTHYNCSIWGFEPMNEADQTTFWSGTVAQAATFTNGVAAAVKAACPKTQILFPSTSGHPGYMAQLLALVSPTNIDYMNFHGYNYDIGSSPAQHIAEAMWNASTVSRGLFNQYGFSAKPFVVDEGGQFTVNIPDAYGQAVYASKWDILLASTGAVFTDWHTLDEPASSTIPLWNGAGCPGSNLCLDAAGIAYRTSQEVLSDATFATKVLRVASTNLIRNPSASGAVAGTPGTIPTNWQLVAPDSARGIVTQVVGTGTENGVAYIDFRIHGTLTGVSTSSTILYFEQNTQIDIRPLGAWLFITDPAQTTFDVPADWSSSNSIHAIGPGGDSGAAVSNTNSGGGGGGGAHAEIDNLALTPSTTVTVQIGTHGTTQATFLKNNASTTVVSGDYGRTGSTSTAGIGGTTASSVGTSLVSGCTGGSGGAFANRGGGGGGGAASPTSGSCTGGSPNGNITGGGGGPVKGAASTTAGNGTATQGGAGGQNPLGTGAGVGAQNGIPGTQGINGAGSGGGYPDGSNSNGIAGTTFQLWNAFLGPGSGGSGGGGNGAVAGNGGAGGSCGGGGGGAGAGTSAAGSIGLGSNGCLAINYAPTGTAKLYNTGAYFKLVSGSTTGLTDVRLIATEINGAGSFLGFSMLFNVIPTTNALDQDLVAYSQVPPNANTAFLVPGVEFDYAIGVPFDITLRIGAPNVDAGSIWTGTISKSVIPGYLAKIIWDANGRSSPSPFSVPGTYTSCRKITTGVPMPIVGGNITLTDEPSICENAPHAGFL